MKQTNSKLRLVSTVLALTAIAGTSPAKANLNINTHHPEQQKAIVLSQKEKKQISINNHGGLDFPTYYSTPGLSPKEYGLRYGNGRSRKAKINYNRLSHNYKVKHH